MPPIGDRSSGAWARAVSVIAAASAADVWSFQSHACAARLFCHFGSSASGRACASTGSGVDPVVSAPMPITRSRANAGIPLGFCQRAANGDAQPLDVVRGILPRQVRLLRIEQDALLAARIVEDARADDAPVGGIDDDGANRVGPVVDADGERSLIHDSRWCQLLNATMSNSQ